ncbi:MAG: ATP synthase F1 subunit delta [Crocinitomicaceae bacterium]|nr:ATP synthase F1 subunit delta [Crocinitomicaceae bacterium]MBP6033497.1 ATP synthase F1 subunit delta [Crocinitomicaceae bacterium]
MKSTKAAGRYAKALLELALDQQKIEVIENNMQQIITVANEAHDFQVFLSSPLIKVDKKLEIIKSIFGNFDALSISFLEMIATNRREVLITEIASSFLTQLKEHRGIVPVTIISAKTLDAQTKNEITSKISASIKGTIEITENVDESLIGGFIVRMGDHQIDASVSNQLNRLKQELVK